MSLQHAAKHLAAHGRGKDTELIHMDKGEIASLQQIAMAHGGSLTINPQTGLPEAGFLSAILPMALGAGLMMIPGMQAGAAGLIVGGLQTARTGSLKQGIMAGLGAYGGAGLAGSAGAAGATQAGVNATNAGASAAQGLEATEAAQAAAKIAAPQSAVPTIAQTTASTTPNFLQDFGPKTGFETPSMPTTSGGLDVAKSAPIPQYGPSYTDAQSFGGPSAGATAATPTATPSFADMNASQRFEAIKAGASPSNAGKFIADNKYTAAGTAASIAAGMQKDPTMSQPDKDMGQRYSYSPGTASPLPAPDVPSYDQMLYGSGNYGRQQKYFSPSYTPISNTAAKDLYNYAAGGPVEQMSNQAAMGTNTMYPMANMTTSSFATPYQSPVSTNMLAPTSDVGVGMGGEPNMQGTRLAKGGISDAGYNLGGYSDGGRLLRGPGDGVSDSIPAVIGKKQPARLADGEFVVPARIVSELGNGSTEAGARKLYAMMDRIQKARKKTVGKNKVAHNSRSDKYLPA